MTETKVEKTLGQEIDETIAELKRLNAEERAYAANWVEICAIHDAVLKSFGVRRNVLAKKWAELRSLV